MGFHGTFQMEVIDQLVNLRGIQINISSLAGAFSVEGLQERLDEFRTQRVPSTESGIDHGQPACFNAGFGGVRAVLNMFSCIVVWDCERNFLRL